MALERLIYGGGGVTDGDKGDIIVSAGGTVWTLDSTVALSNVARTTVRKNGGADVGSRRRLNLIEGANITLTVTDDAGNEEVDITIAASAGGSPNAGQTEVDFGAFPGAFEASAVVTGQTGIVGTSKVFVTLAARTTVDHSEDEHRVEQVAVMAGSIVAGTGFTIYAAALAQSFADSNAFRRGQSGSTGNTPQLYGKWAVNWMWV